MKKEIEDIIKVHNILKELFGNKLTTESVNKLIDYIYELEEKIKILRKEK